MEKIEGFDELSGIMTCQTGCTIDKLESKAREQGFTVNLGTSNRQIGDYATSNVVNSIVGLEVVKADGKIVNLMSDAHLKNLFIGSNNKYGLITRLAIQCTPHYESHQVGFFSLKDYNFAMKVYKMARRLVGDTLICCNLYDQASLSKSIQYTNQKSPIKFDCAFYMLIRTNGCIVHHEQEKMKHFFDTCNRDGLVVEGVIGDEMEMASISRLVEQIPEALSTDGFVFKYDLCLPMLKLYDIIPLLRTWIGKMATCICAYGSLSNSSIRINITCPTYDNEVRKLLEPLVFEFAKKLNGRVASMPNYTKSQEAIQMMDDLKEVMDPNGILNSK
jgi:FAD/FMN-containing dehydrogenase